MLNRLLMGAAGLVAGTLVATPAVLGLSDNSSFRRDLQVPVPSGAHSVTFATPTPTNSREDRLGHDVLSSDASDDHGGLRGSAGISSSARSGDDDGLRHDVGDDHGGRRGGSGSDDNSGSGSGSNSGSDDNGGSGSGGNSGSGGSDDDSGHGGHG
ncbi:MAG: hypothetical protein QOH89_2383 [Pseudonocardiales bacterium]|nr:hypothetical protein [Pseudonocardiales bacterium]